MSSVCRFASNFCKERDKVPELKFYLAFGECSKAFMPKLPPEVKESNLAQHRQNYQNIREYLANSRHISDWTRVVDSASTIDDITNVFASHIRFIPMFRQSWILSDSSLGKNVVLIRQAAEKKKRCTEILSMLDQPATSPPFEESSRISSASQGTEMRFSSPVTLTELLGNQSATPKYLWVEVISMATLVESSSLKLKARFWIENIKSDVNLDLTFPTLTQENLPVPSTCETFSELVYELSLQFLEEKLDVPLKGNVRDTLISMFKKSEYCRIIILEKINNACYQGDILDNVNICRHLLSRYKDLIAEFVDSSITLPNPLVDCMTRAIVHCLEVPLPCLGFHKHLFWPLTQIAKDQGHVLSCEQHEIFFEDVAVKIAQIEGIERSLQTYVAAISCPFLRDALSHLPGDVVKKASLDRITQYLQFARFFFPEDALVFLQEETKTPVVVNRRHVLTLITMIQNNYEKFSTDVITLINLYSYLLFQGITHPLISHIKGHIFNDNWIARKGGAPINKSKCEKLLENYQQKGAHNARIKELVFEELKKIPELTDPKSALTYSKLSEMQIAIKDFLPKQVASINLFDILLAQQACIARLSLEETIQRLRRLNDILDIEKEEEMQPDLYLKVASLIIKNKSLIDIYYLIRRDREQGPGIDRQLHFFAFIGLEENIREKITSCLSYVTIRDNRAKLGRIESHAERDLHTSSIILLKTHYLKQVASNGWELLFDQLIEALT